MSEAKLLNELNKLVRKRFGNHAVEALIGMISTLATKSQLEFLVISLTKQEQND